NGQYLDPVFLGRYPEEMREIFGAAWPEWPAADHELIKQKLDFIGLNYYTRSVTRDAPEAWPVRAGRVIQPQAT
ncbi:Glycoside hydrolase, family 1, partial [mine drainage metagenome]